MFLKEPTNDDRIEFMGNANNPLRTVVGISALVTITSVFYIDPLLEMISTYVQMSGF
jgi:NADH-quinone oxidoreductase subunit N